MSGGAAGGAESGRRKDRWHLQEFKVQVARRFKIEERRGVDDRPGFGEWELDVPYLHGVYAHGNGWVAGAANSTNRCSTTQAPPTTSGFTAEEVWHGVSMHLPGPDNYRVLSSQSQVICVGELQYYTLLYPNYFDVWTLTQKTLSGPAIPAPLTWLYAYGDNAGVALPCPGCAATKNVVVTEPDGATVTSRFGVLFEENEGRLLGEEVQSPEGIILRDTVHEYASSAGTYPDVYGASLITGFDPVANRIRPLIGTTITQQGRSFDVDHGNFDVFGRARDHTKFSNLSGNPSKTERTTFHDDYDIWVLGQTAKTALLGSPEIEMSETTYDATLALPQTQEVYGRLDRSFEWHLSQGATQQKGRLWKLKDAQNRAYELGNYYRGVPRSIVLPTSASHTMTATVDYFGNLSTVTDAMGFQTGYLYDSMDRLQQINWPSGDTQAWLPTTIAYVRTTSSEHGVPSGLWKRTETTGALVKETWFDAFWRPILDRESASDASTTATFWRRGFDHRNRQTFAAYPLASLTDGSYLNATVGSTNTFDALDRTIRIDAAAEAPHDTVTTSFFYDLNFITRVRDARNYETSTSFLAWDTPSTEFPTVIAAAEGQTTTILRDVFGKPRKLTRSGTWNGNPIAVDRDYVYDAHQRLCKTIELESGSPKFDS